MKTFSHSYQLFPQKMYVGHYQEGQGKGAHSVTCSSVKSSPNILGTSTWAKLRLVASIQKRTLGQAGMNQRCHLIKVFERNYNQKGNGAKMTMFRKKPRTLVWPF